METMIFILQIETVDLKHLRKKIRFIPSEVYSTNKLLASSFVLIEQRRIAPKDNKKYFLRPL